MGIESWSTSAGSNNMAPPAGWPGGMLPSQVEPTGRQMMASLATWYQAAEWINYNFPIVYSSGTVFTISTNVTALYHVGRRVQATDGSTSVFGTITASAFTSITTVTVVWDTGVLQTGVTIVYVGITSKINTSAPSQATSFANPSATIGLTAVNGTATTAMTSDSAPALSQSIVPTWTGLHTFNGKLVIGAPVSGVPVTVGANDNATAILVNDASSVNGVAALTIENSGVVRGQIGTGAAVQTGAALGDLCLVANTGTLRLGNGSTIAVSLSNAGNLSVNAPGSGTAVTATAVANQYAIKAVGSSTTGQSAGILVNAGTNSSDTALAVQNQPASVTYFLVRGDGVVQGNDGTNLFELGYKDIPQNLQTASYQLVLADRGKSILLTTNNTLTLTIPANASVAFPIGTTIVVATGSNTGCTVAITTDNLILAGAGTTGTRSLSAFALATLYKVNATSWLISGSGVS